MNPVERQLGTSPDAAVGKGVEKKELEKAAQDFEAYFVGQIFEHAYRAIPKSDFFGGGEEVALYQSMLIERLTQEGAHSGRGFGLGKQIIDQVTHEQQSTFKKNV